MAKRLMKKAVAVFLAVIMVVSSIPVFAVTAFAADGDDAVIASANDALLAYQNKMKDLNDMPYTNMADAFQKYAELTAMVDRYNYIGKIDGIAAKTTELVNATNSLTVWESYQGTQYMHNTNDGDNNSAAEYAQTNKNLLYAPDVTKVASTGDITIYTTKVLFVTNSTFYRGDVYTSNGAVMLYDGKTTPMVPIGCQFTGWQGGTYDTDAAEIGCWISNGANGLAINEIWNGRDTRLNLQWMLVNDLHRTGTGKDSGVWSGSPTTIYLSGVPNTRNDHACINYKNGTGYYANELKFTASMNANEMTRTINPLFTFYSGNETNGLKNETKNQTTAGPTMYVVNYKALLDKLKAQVPTFKNISNYSHGSALQLMQAIDAATAYNPTTVNYASDTANTVASVGEQISTLIENITLGADSSNLIPNSTKHKVLGDQVKESKVKYDIGNGDAIYDATAWDNFATAYEAAYTIIDNLPNSLYTDYAITAEAAAALKTATDALVPIGRADTSALEISINNALDAIRNQSFYTAASFSEANLAALVSAAQTAVWGAPANYLNDGKKLTDTAANAEIIAQQAAAVNAGIAKLRINVDSQVHEANDATMNSAINDAQDPIAHKADYANIAVVENAVAAARTFITSGNVAVNGAFKGSVQAKVDEYEDLVIAIEEAIRDLKPSLMNTQNGDLVNRGTVVNNLLTHKHSASSGYFKLNWEHSTGLVFMRTTHDAFTRELEQDNNGNSINNAMWYYNRENYDSLIDSLSLVAPETTDENAEITASTKQNETAVASPAQYNGQLTIDAGGIHYDMYSIVLKDIKGGSDDYGKAIDGSAINDATHNWVTELATAEGGSDGNGGFRFAGGPITKKGTNTFAIKSRITMPETSDELTASTKPSVSTLSAQRTGAKWGMFYYWAYYNFPSKWMGYAYTKEGYSLDVSVIDIASLLDLIKLSEGIASEDGAQTRYTAASWSAFVDALGKAKAEIDYEDDVNNIGKDLGDRYTALWTAYRGLKAPASNAELKAAVNDYLDVYTNDAAKCEATSFAAFQRAYRAAAEMYIGDYSDAKFTAYVKGGDEEKNAKALAKAVVDAYNALKYFADFAELDAAASALASSIETKKYPASTLKAIKTALADATYLNKDSAARAVCYKTADPATDDQSKIDAEKDTVTGLADLLVKSSYDDEALQAAIAALKAQVGDPDAWDGITAAVAALESKWYEDVNIYKDITVKGMACDSQAEVDALTTEALSTNIRAQKYDVTVDGEKIGTYNYGEQITVESSSGNVVNWYYAYTSNTATNDKKFYATDSTITFVVKGNTSLTTSAVKDSNTNNIKITYKNNLNGKPYAVQYAAKGVATQLEANAPVLSNFAFTNYTDAEGNPITSVTSDEDVTVYANYTYSSTTTKYSVTLAGMVATGTNNCQDYIKITGLNYNDEVSFVMDKITGKAASDAVISIDSTSDSVQVNYLVKSTATSGTVNATAVAEGKEYTIPGGARTFLTTQTGAIAGNNRIDAYVSFASAADCEAYLAYSAKKVPQTRITELVNAGTIDKMHVESYGKDYIFRVHKDEYIMPMGSNQLFGYYDNSTTVTATSLAYTGALEGFENAAGIADISSEYAAKNTIKPLISAKETIVKGTGKFSMIGTFSLPDGYTEVEAGMLFCSNGTATATSEDLTLNNVGKNGVARMKSSQHTLANQFVISVNTGSMAGPLGMQYAAYLIYKDASGVQHTIISDTVSGSFALA